MINNIRFKFIILNFIFITIWQQSTYAQLNYQIKGSVDNSVFFHQDFSIKDGDLITLEFINIKRIDSAIVLDGKFYFNGNVDIPSVATINYNNGGFLLLIDESSYNVILKVVEVAADRYSYDNINVETKSKFYNLWRTLNLQKGNLMTTKKEIQSLLKEDLIEAERNSYLSELEEIDIKLSKLYKDASIKYNSSYEMTYLLPAAPDFSYTRYIDFYNQLPLDIKNSFYGKNFYNRLIQTKTK